MTGDRQIDYGSDMLDEKTPRVTIMINGRRETFFLGLRVRHAVGWDWVKAVQTGRALITDADGNRVDIDGALYDGEILRVRHLAESDL